MPLILFQYPDATEATYNLETELEIAAQPGVFAMKNGVRMVGMITDQRSGTISTVAGDTKATRKPGPTPQIAQLTERLSKLPRAQQKMVTAMLEAALQRAS